MKSGRKYLFWGFWGLVAIGVTASYFVSETDADFLGVVETRIHKLSALESGRISRIYVSLGELVSGNQLLVDLDASGLDVEQAWLQDELKRQEDQLNSDRARYELEYNKLKLQSDSDAMGMDMRKSDLAGKVAEYESVKAEIARLIAAEQAGLGRSRDLSDLIIRRDTLGRLISTQRTVLTGRTDTQKVRGAAATKEDQDRVVMSMLSENIEKINEIKQKLKTVETRRVNRKVISPSPGRVVNINYLPGDSVDAFLTILTVEEPDAEFIDVYIPETSDRMPSIGGRVNIYPHRLAAADAHGSIVFIDPGYSAIPQRLAFRDMIYWARKFRVKLDPGHQLMPGEAVRVEMLDSVDHTFGSAFASSAKTPGVEPAQVSPACDGPVRGPESLLPITLAVPRGSFEPSGVAWLEDIKRYVIVSDDTGDADNKHAPWLFLMDADGVVEAEPVILQGVKEINDLESIAMAPDGFIYLVSSQNLNKKGKRPEVRQQILKVKREGRSFTVVGAVSLYDVLAASCDSACLKGIGLGQTADNGQLELNIEGAAWRDGALLLGLKAPVSEKGAMIWHLKNPDALFEKARLEPGQLSVLGTVDLGFVNGRRASISDLLVAGNADIYVLSTVPQALDSEQTGRLFKLTSGVGGAFDAVSIVVFPGVKAEGICLTDESSFTVVFDADNAPAKFYRGTWARP
jgi:multidrug resistance efflux pump